MGNPFVYVQLHTRDLDNAKRFYGGMFDWQFDQLDTPAGPYMEIRVGQGTAGGMTTVRQTDPGPHWCPYVGVDDIEAVTNRAAALGATVVQGPTQLPDGSLFSVVTDPDGVPLALHQRPSDGPGAARG
jgi:predicted enzyme related to lactoylglutathione lyase